MLNWFLESKGFVTMADQSDDTEDEVNSILYERGFVKTDCQIQKENSPAQVRRILFVWESSAFPDQPPSRSQSSTWVSLMTVFLCRNHFSWMGKVNIVITIIIKEDCYLPATSVIILSMVRRHDGTPCVTLAHALGDENDGVGDGEYDDHLVPLLPPMVMHSSLRAVPPISTFVSRPWLIVHLKKLRQFRNGWPTC